MQSRLPPGPKLPAFLQLAAGLLAAPRVLEHCHRKYGDRFTVRLGPLGTFVFLADLADIKTVFHSPDTDLHAGEANAVFLERTLGTSSVLVTDEGAHLRQRRRLSGPLHGDAVTRLEPLMTEIAAAEIDSWPVGREFALGPSMRAIALEIILRTVIGTSDEECLTAERETLEALVDINLLRVMQFAQPALDRWWPWSRYCQIERRADQLLREEIRSRRADPGLAERRDVLSLLVRHREDDGSEISEDELRDQLVTLLLAGHETTAAALAWTFERLVRHPAVLQRAVKAALDGDDGYLDAVITESLRVRPIITDVTRRLTTELRLGEYVLPAGMSVDPAILLVQRSPRYYPDPLRFDPERFVGRRPDQTIWLPFGGGNRRCLGAAFALVEMRVVLREVLTRVELAISSARGERAKVRHVTLTPHAGARVTVLRRHETQGQRRKTTNGNGRRLSTEGGRDAVGSSSQ